MAKANTMKQKMIERENAIKTFMENLDITREEAEELYKFDNEEVTNEVADAIEEKIAATSKAKGEKRSSLEKVKNQKAKKKADASKEGIIAAIFGFVQGSDLMVNAQEMSATKMSFKDAEGNYYTVAITKHKSKPDGYTD